MATKAVLDNASLRSVKTSDSSSRCSIAFGNSKLTVGGAGSTACVIDGVAPPTQSAHAVNKQYLDEKIAEASTGE